MLPRLSIFAIVAVLATGASGCGGDGDGSKNDVAQAVASQLRYLESGSSLVVAVDLRYENENWDKVRALASRVLREYRSLADGADRLTIPPNLTGALNLAAGFVGLSFDKDIRPLLDGYLVVGVTLPPREPLPADIAELEDSMRNAFYDRRRRAYVSFNSGLPRIVRRPDGRPVRLAEGRRVVDAVRRRDDAAEPRIVVTYRTGSKRLRGVATKLLEGNRVEPLQGHKGVSLLDREIAVVDDDTLVLATGGPPERSRSSLEVSRELLSALERREAGRGFDAQRLSVAQRGLAVSDPLALAVGDLGIARILVEEPNLMRARTEIPYLRAITGLQAALTIDAKSLSGIGRAVTKASTLTDSDLPFGPAGELDLPDRDDAIVGASRDQSATTAFLTKLARTLFEGSYFVRAVNRAERELNIRFEDEFLRQFSCPSVSIFEPVGTGPREQRFAARSCVQDPARMRALLPRLAPHLPRIITGIQSLDDQGLATLLLVAPDAPLIPSFGKALAAILVRPLKGGGERPSEQLYEMSGLRDRRRALAQAGPDRVVFGMIGDVFVVASDPEAARGAAEVGTRRYSGRAASVLGVPPSLLLSPFADSTEGRIAARVLKDLFVEVAGTRQALTLRARADFAR